MKKILITLLLLATGCATNHVEDVTDTLATNKQVKTTVVTKKVVTKAVKPEPVSYNIKGALQEKLEDSYKIIEYLDQSNKEKSEYKVTQVLKLEESSMVESNDLAPLVIEEKWSEKLYNLTIKPIKKEIIKWNIYINKEIPKYMKTLKHEPSLWAILISLFAAFVYGIIHTLGPGHGKMVIATYFLTQNAKIINGVMLGFKTAFAHVGGAIVLVLVTNVAVSSLALDQEKHMYLLKNISYSLIVLVGLVMLIQAIMHMFSSNKHHGCNKCASLKNKGSSKKDTFVSICIGSIPCTGSLLILLYAMSNDILYLGILMVVFVALGMALTMIVLGLISIIYKNKVLDNYFMKNDHHHSHKYKLILETTGALLIMLIGILFLLSNVR